MSGVLNESNVPRTLYKVTDEFELQEVVIVRETMMKVQIAGGYGSGHLVKKSNALAGCHATPEAAIESRREWLASRVWSADAKLLGAKNDLAAFEAKYPKGEGK